MSINYRTMYREYQYWVNVWGYEGIEVAMHIHCTYKTMWTPLHISGFGYYSNTFVDSCIKLSTLPCNLRRQTLEEECPYWRAQWHSTWHRHRMPPFQQVSSSNFYPARAALVNCKSGIVKWKRLGAPMAQPRGGRPNKLIELDCWVLKQVARLSSIAALTIEF
jgi:hypothetical protein